MLRAGQCFHPRTPSKGQREGGQERGGGGGGLDGGRDAHTPRTDVSLKVVPELISVYSNAGEQCTAKTTFAFKGVKGHTASLPNRLNAAVFVSPDLGSLLSKLQHQEVTGQSPTLTFKQLRIYQTSLWVEQEVMIRILSRLRDTNVKITLVFFKQLLCCMPKPQRKAHI